MNELLERLRPGRGASAFEQDGQRSWRRVPRLNVLPRQGAASSSRTLLRAALLAIVLLVLGYLLVQVRGRSADQGAAESARTELQQVQGELALEQAAIDELQGKVDEARKRVEAATAGYQLVTSGRTDWYSGLSALLDTRIEGVVFTSIVASPGREISVGGDASDLEAMARFQGRLRDVSQWLRLRNISFETSSTALRFTATLQVVR